MRLSLKRRALFFVLNTLFVYAAYGQVPYFQSHHLLRKNESVHVNTIFQDKTGFIWYGTNKGLFRTDGINQIRYTVADSLPDDQVTAIGQDSSGKIWTGHKNGKLAYFENGLIKTFNPREGAAVEEVSDILFDKKGNLWFSTFNDGLYYYTEERLFRLDDADNMPDLYIYDIAEDKQGNIWAGTDRGIAICTLNGKRASIKTLNYTKGLPDNIIKKIEFDSAGTAWLGTEDTGVILYNPSTGSIEPALKNKWTYGSVTDFVRKGSQIWIATQQSGLVVYDKKTEQINLFDAKNIAGFTSATTLMKDREDNIWLGSRDGILRTQGDYIEHIEAFEPAKDANIVALTIDQSGDIWFSNSEGLFKRTMDASGNAIIKRQLLQTPFQNYSIISLYSDDFDNVWAGLYGEGVLRINIKSGKIQRLARELRNGSVMHISGKKNSVWLATLGGSTEIKINGEQLSVKNYSSIDGLVSDYIYQVFIDSKDRVWFATDRAGIDMLDNQGFHHYKEGLQSKVIYGFAEDLNHQIWANVQGYGLYKFDEKVFKLWESNALIRDNNINCFSSDLAGNLVMMHDLGIDIYDVKNDKIKYLGEESGIKLKVPNLNAVAKDRLGNTYFGTERGIVKYTDISENGEKVPQPQIINLKLFDKNVPMQPNMQLDYDQNNLTFSYLGFWYQNPTELTYLYKLDNYDRDWINSKDRSAVYSSLPPGKYTFRLKASETGIFKNSNEIVFDFQIHPPFWRTPWFYISSVILILVIAYGIVKAREEKLKHDNWVLETKIEERTREIQMKNDEIMTQNEEIQAQKEEISGINENLELLVKQRTSELEKKNMALEEYAFINAHNLRAPVASILGLIYLLRNTDVSSDEVKAIFEKLQESAKRLESTVRSITDAIERGDT